MKPDLVMITAELELEVDQLHVDAGKVVAHDFIDFERHGADGMDILLRCKAACDRVGIIGFS